MMEVCITLQTVGAAAILDFMKVVLAEGPKSVGLIINDQSRRKLDLK